MFSYLYRYVDNWHGVFSFYFFIFHTNPMLFYFLFKNQNSTNDQDLFSENFKTMFSRKRVDERELTQFFKPIFCLVSRSAMFFPLRTPICVHHGSTLEVHFWRCCDSSKVGFASFDVFHRISLRLLFIFYFIAIYFNFLVKSETGLVWVVCYISYIISGSQH